MLDTIPKEREVPVAATYHGVLGEELVGLEDWSTGVAEAGVHFTPAAETHLKKKRGETGEEKTSIKP